MAGRDSPAAAHARRRKPARRDFLGRMIAAGASLAAAGAVPRLAAQSRFLTAATLDDGFELYYEVHGEGPAVVFAHGAGGDASELVATDPRDVRALRGASRSIIGASATPATCRPVRAGPRSSTISMDFSSTWASAGWRSSDSPWGGWTTLGFASAWPERVSALVLCDTPGGYTDPEVARLMGAAAGRARGLRSVVRRTRAGARVPVPRDSSVRRSIARRRPARGPRRDLLAASTDIGPILAHAIPTLFGVGDEDSIFAPAALEAMHRKMP